MFRRSSPILLLILALTLVGCTIDISQQTYGTPPIQTLYGPTDASPGSYPILPAYASSPVLPTTTVPVTWSGLNLSGHLVYLTGDLQDNNPYVKLQSLDRLNGGVTTLYQTPPIWWISTASVSPNDRQVVLSYASPTTFPALYLMPLDGSSAPRRLFTPPSKNDEYIEPVWSPDGKYIYFVHTNFSLPPKGSNQLFPLFEIDRIASPGGTPEKLLTDAYWPRLSLDGSQLMYVSENPSDKNDRLFISAADGSHPRRVMLKGSVVPTIIDAPVFLPGGQLILFSAPVPVEFNLHMAGPDFRGDCCFGP